MMGRTVFQTVPRIGNPSYTSRQFTVNGTLAGDSAVKRGHSPQGCSRAGPRPAPELALWGRRATRRRQRLSSNRPLLPGQPVREALSWQTGTVLWMLRAEDLPGRP